MKKTFLIFFGLLTNFIFSQEIHSIYKFKKQQQKKLFNYYELDSLVLYKNGSFYQTYSYNYHEINYSEIKGDWKIENGILILSVNEKNDSKNNPNWEKTLAKYRYKIKRKKLSPIETTIVENKGEKKITYYFLPPKKLKLLPN